MGRNAAKKEKHNSFRIQKVRKSDRKFCLCLLRAGSNPGSRGKWKKKGRG